MLLGGRNWPAGPSWRGQLLNCGSSSVATTHHANDSSSCGFFFSMRSRGQHYYSWPIIITDQGLGSSPCIPMGSKVLRNVQIDIVTHCRHAASFLIISDYFTDDVIVVLLIHSSRMFKRCSIFVHFTTVLYTRWRFDNYKKGEFYLENKIGKNSWNFVDV